MTDWLGDCEKACEKWMDTLRKGGEAGTEDRKRIEEEYGDIARTALPRAIAALRAADTLTKAADLVVEGQAQQVGRLPARIKLLHKALAAYQEARK